MILISLIVIISEKGDPIWGFDLHFIDLLVATKSAFRDPTLQVVHFLKVGHSTSCSLGPDMPIRYQPGFAYK